MDIHHQTLEHLVLLQWEKQNAIHAGKLEFQSLNEPCNDGRLVSGICYYFPYLRFRFGVEAINDTIYAWKKIALVV